MRVRHGIPAVLEKYIFKTGTILEVFYHIDVTRPYYPGLTFQDTYGIDDFAGPVPSRETLYPGQIVKVINCQLMHVDFDDNHEPRSIVLRMVLVDIKNKDIEYIVEVDTLNGALRETKTSKVLYGS